MEHFLILLGIMSWVSYAVFGLIAGAIAKLIMPGDDPGGIFVTMLIGIVGAIIGGGIMSLVWEAPDSNWSIYGFISAVVGALLVLFVWKKFIAPMLNKK